MRERNPLEIIEQRQTDSFEHWLRIGQSPLALCRDHPEAEYVETKARFLAVTAGAGEWATIHRELGDLNGLSLDEIMRRGPAPIVCSQDSIKSKTRFLANPHGRSSRRPSRSASM